MTPDTTWMDKGACRGTPPNTMHPTDRDGERRAKAACATCTVRNDCLRYALDNHEEYGVWGGTSEDERRALRVPVDQEHGTVAGHSAHLRRKTTPCGPCRDAYNKYQRTQRVRKVAA